MRIKVIPPMPVSLVLLLLLSCGSVVAKAEDETKGPQATSKGAVNRSVKRIITETLKEGEGVVNGVKVWRRVPPAHKNIEEIRRYGDEAVAALTNHLNAESDRERALAVVLVGHLGGSRVVAPLRTWLRRLDHLICESRRYAGFRRHLQTWRCQSFEKQLARILMKTSVEPQDVFWIPLLLKKFLEAPRPLRRYRSKYASRHLRLPVRKLHAYYESTEVQANENQNH